MREKITLAEALELVEFRHVDGKWVVEDVKGDVEGAVWGDVVGDVKGDVWGPVWGDVWGPVWGAVWGPVLNHEAEGRSA